MIAMKYHYNGKTIILNDTLMKQYEEMNGSKISDLDISCAIQSSKITLNNVTDEELSKAVADSMSAEVGIWND